MKADTAPGARTGGQAAHRMSTATRTETVVLRMPGRSALRVAAAVVACLAGSLPGLPLPAAGAAAPAAPGGPGPAAGNPFCRGLGKHYQASSGAYVFCRRARPHGSSGVPVHAPLGKPAPGAPGNVDAASSAEDV